MNPSNYLNSSLYNSNMRFILKHGITRLTLGDRRETSSKILEIMLISKDLRNGNQHIVWEHPGLRLGGCQTK